MDANLKITINVGRWIFCVILLIGTPQLTLFHGAGSQALKNIRKTYLANADNIAKYTNLVITTNMLAACANPLPYPSHPTVGPVPQSNIQEYALRTVQFITGDDLSAEYAAVATATYSNVFRTQPA